MKKLFAGVIVVLLAAAAAIAVAIPEQEVLDPFIRWVGYIPGEKTNTGIFRRALNLITGPPLAELNNPVNLYASDPQSCWIINQGDGKVVEYRDGSLATIPAFRRESAFMPSLVGICGSLPEGMLVSDSRLNSVYLVEWEGRQYRKFNGADDLNRPTGIAYSLNNDEIWVVETGSHRITVLDRRGVRIRVLGKRGNGPLEFNYPTYIWIDTEGKVYIVDSMNYRVQVLNSKGEFITAFGRQGNVTGSFARPRGIATDSEGNIYIVDGLANVVQIFDISGQLLHYFGSQGQGRYQFWMPSGIFIDQNDYIYISDSYNSRIQIFQAVKGLRK